MDELRKKIDAIDARMVQLLARRLKFSKKIGKLKKAEDREVHDESREADLLRNVCELAAAKGLDKSYVEELYKRILKESRSIQEIQ